MPSVWGFIFVYDLKCWGVVKFVSKWPEIFPSTIYEAVHFFLLKIYLKFIYFRLGELEGGDIGDFGWNVGLRPLTQPVCFSNIL